MVYRFGHSMLTENINRVGTNMQSDDIGLIAAFLNPVEFDKLNGVQVDVTTATGAIIRGMTRDTGNEIDEFVTEALRNNLVGLPLDLAVLNMARARDTGMPSFNEARAAFFAATGDSQLDPFTSWADMTPELKNPMSIVNFIAAKLFGIKHFTWLCINPKEADDPGFAREVISLIPSCWHLWMKRKISSHSSLCLVISMYPIQMEDDREESIASTTSEKEIKSESPILLIKYLRLPDRRSITIL